MSEPAQRVVYEDRRSTFRPRHCAGGARSDDLRGRAKPLNVLMAMVGVVL
jgi:hypothetical protein